MRGARNRTNRMISIPEFMTRNTKNNTPRFFKDELFRIIHTTYLKKFSDNQTSNLKKQIIDSWRCTFSFPIDDESIDFLRGYLTVFVADQLNEEVMTGSKIRSNKQVDIAFVGLGFDVWLLQCMEDGRKPAWEDYKSWLAHESEVIPEPEMKNFFDLFMGPKEEIDFKKLHSYIAPYKEQILLYYQSFKNGNLLIRKKENNKTNNKGNEKVLAVSESVKSYDEFTLYMEEKDDHIKKLTDEIERLRLGNSDLMDKLMERSDKTIVDTFRKLNSKDYGQVIDFLYKTVQMKSADDTLLAYLGNFFCILEDIGIVPATELHIDECVEFSKAMFRTTYDTDFDISEYDEQEVHLKSSGWKYKKFLIEKPVVAKE